MTPLWPFALAFYAEDGVAPACLHCQDDAGADVNLILFLLWQSRIGVRFDADEIAGFDREVQPWREHVIEKLRLIRRYLRDSGHDGLRARVKTSELEAERLELEALTRHARSPGGESPRDGIARANLGAYASFLGRTLPPDAVDVLVEALQHEDLPV